MIEIRSYLGLCSYYRSFVRRFADIAKPLHKLTELDVPCDWTPGCQMAFETLRHALTTAPIISFLIPGKPFIIDTVLVGLSSG